MGPLKAIGLCALLVSESQTSPNCGPVSAVSSPLIDRWQSVISEASRRVDQGFKDRHPGLPWVQIAAAGNVYRHDYRIVRADIVWETVQKALPPLLEAIEAELGPAP